MKTNTLRQKLRNESWYIALAEKKNRFLYPFKNATHIMKEVLHRLPNPVYLTRHALRNKDERILTFSHELKKSGICFIENYMTGEQLSRLQSDFNKMIDYIKTHKIYEKKSLPKPWEWETYIEYDYDIVSQSTFTNNPFRFNVELLQVAVDPFIFSIVEEYFGKAAIMHQAVAHRYEPMPPKDFGSWQWHHDGWGKRVNALLILSDVSENDQYMSYCKGSHTRFHSLNKTIHSRFNENELRKLSMNRINCTCKAGTMILIDSNGIHRGNRSMGMHRDTLITSYSTGRYIWPFDIPQSFVNKLSAKQKAYLLRNKKIRQIANQEYI